MDMADYVEDESTLSIMSINNKRLSYAVSLVDSERSNTYKHNNNHYSS